MTVTIYESAQANFRAMLDRAWKRYEPLADETNCAWITDARRARVILSTRFGSFTIEEASGRRSRPGGKMLAPIIFDGRKFYPAQHELPANQEDYIIGHLREAGAIDVLSEIGGKQPTKEKRAEDLLTRIMLSGRTYCVLAGSLIEEGKAWNRTEADANAARFGVITDSEEKSEMRKCLVRFIIGFFSFGEPSPETSEKSSSESEKTAPAKTAAASS